MLTKLTPLELYAISVPKEAECYLIQDEYVKWLVLNNTNLPNIPISKKYEIVGEVTKDSIYFDPVDYVEKTDNPFHYGRGYLFIDYTNDTNCFETSEESFYSLLADNGVHFVNPMGEKPIVSNYTKEDFKKMDSETITKVLGRENDLLVWQSYESNLVDKIVTLKQVK